MCRADSSIGASEYDNVLHGLRFKAWIMSLLEVGDSEVSKDDVNGLLESACDKTENFKHCKCRNGGLELNYIPWKAQI